MSEFKLISEIIKSSVNKDWEIAKKEWYVKDIEYSENIEFENHSCACGHNPIKEICNIANKENGEKLKVGNCCVKKFMPEQETNLIFIGLKQLKKNKLPNNSFLKYAISQNCLLDDELISCNFIRQKKNLDESQLKFKNKIIKRLLFVFVNKK